MAMQTQHAARAYVRVGLQSSAMSASPHQLIVMLFDGAVAALKKASRAIAQGDLAAKSAALSKAIEIIASGLQAALDVERGDDIAADLDALYDYMIRTLMRANLRSDQTLVAEVASLLDDIGSAWKDIARGV